MSDRKFGGQAKTILATADTKVRVKTIYAGKFRRYSNVSKLRQLTYPPIFLRNIRDFFLVFVGYVQSLIQLIKFRPDVVFTKGGFVCLPVGMAAATLRIPLVIHDSDSHAGLTNRVLARWAKVIATGAPLENYNYDKHRSVYVGIPVDASYHPLNAEERKLLKGELGLPDVTWPLVTVTGGGLGSNLINQSMLAIADALIEQEVAVVHIAGTEHGLEVEKAAPKHQAYIVKPFMAGLQTALNAADIVVTRAGATTLAELAASKKPTIIIPSRVLAGGHQLKNAAVYEKADAALVIDEGQIENNPTVLLRAIQLLLSDPKRAEALADNFYATVKTNAAKALAALIVKVYADKHHSHRQGE